MSLVAKSIKGSHLDAVRDQIRCLLGEIAQGLDRREERQRQLEKLAGSDPDAFQNMRYPCLPNYVDSTILLYMIVKSEYSYELRTIQAVYEAWPQAGLLSCNHSGPPIFDAISSQRFDVVRFLANACPETLDEPGWLGHTPLHQLLASGHPNRFGQERHDTVELLIGLCPESLTMKNRFGYTPLHCACETYYWTAIHMLLNSNPSAAGCQSQSQRHNYTPLHILCCRLYDYALGLRVKQANLPTFRLLLDAAPHAVTIRTPKDESPLDLYLSHMSVVYGDEEEHVHIMILKWLISANPIISPKSYHYLWIRCDWSIRFYWIKCYVKVKHGTPDDVTDAFPLHSTFSVPPDFWRDYDHRDREFGRRYSSKDRFIKLGKLMRMKSMKVNEQRFSKDRFKVGNLTRENLMKLNEDGLLPLHLALDVLMAMSLIPESNDHARDFLSLLKDMVILAPKSVTIRDPRDGTYPLIRMAMLCKNNGSSSSQSIRLSNANETWTQNNQLGLLFEMMRSAPIGSYPNWKPMV